MKAEKPAKPLVSELPKPSQDFGGDPDDEPISDDMAVEDLGEEPGQEFSEGQGAPRVTDMERQGAAIMGATTKPGSGSRAQGPAQLTSVRTQTDRCRRAKATSPATRSCIRVPASWTENTPKTWEGRMKALAA